MASDQMQNGQKLSLRGALWLAVVSAFAGFGAVYFMAQGPDNGSVPVKDDASPPATAQKQSGNELAAFVKRATPQEVPAFTFQDKDGKPRTLADFKGKTVLLNLWATWCAPCRHEMPALDRLQAAMGSDKFEVVALSLDKDGVEKAQKFLTEIKVSHLQFYIDPTGKEGFNLKPVGLPTTLLIDAEGREVGRLAGPAEWDSEAAKALIAAQLK